MIDNAMQDFLHAVPKLLHVYTCRVSSGGGGGGGGGGEASPPKFGTIV